MVSHMGRKYMESNINTASPMRIILQLYEAAIRHLEQGKQEIATNNLDNVQYHFSKVQDIVQELLLALRPEVAPELCDNLSSLYTFIMSNLPKAQAERDLQLVERMINILSGLLEAWQQVAPQEHQSSPMQAVANAS